MSKPTKDQISEKLQTHLYLKWQTLRRNDDYRKAVATFLREVRSNIRTLDRRWKQLCATGELWLSRAIPDMDTYAQAVFGCPDQTKAYQSVLDTYKRIKTLIRRFNAELSQAERDRFEAIQGEPWVEITHTIMDLIAPYLAQKFLDRVSVLGRFQQEWDMEFPLTPDLLWVIDEVFRSSKTVPVRVTGGDATQRTVSLTIQLDTGLPKELIMACLDTVLSRYLPKEQTRLRAVSKRRVYSLKYYQDAFCAYDLRQQGIAIDEIAKRIWPDDFERWQCPWPEKNRVLQRVHDRIKLTQELIRTAKK
jgi:hypothetical protein